MNGLKAALVLFVAALFQLSVLTEYRQFRTASIVLVALLSIALLRGSVFGAIAGFGTGLLLDIATLGTLGITSRLAFRVALLAFLALAVFAVLFLRLWALQVLSGDKYLAVANDNRVRTLRLEAPRGPVLDRNGNVVVGFVPGWRVELWPADLPKTWRAQRAELQALSGLTGVSLKDILALLNRHAGDPLTPIVVQRGLRQDQI